jgi:hypothetical protein
MLVAIMSKSEEMARYAVQCAKVALAKAQATFDDALEKATKRLEDAEMDVVKAEQYVKQVQAWDQRRDEITTAVRNGATGATIAKTYGLSRARAAQLLYRSQRGLKPDHPPPAPQLTQEEWDAACERFRILMDH